MSHSSERNFLLPLGMLNLSVPRSLLHDSGDFQFISMLSDIFVHKCILFSLFIDLTRLSSSHLK